MHIGEVTRLTGLDAQTIRFYEYQGLLTMPARQANGYRTYTDIHVEQLSFIRRCRMLELSLTDIHVLLKLKSVPHESCEVINTLINGHIAEVQARITSLQTLEKQLTSLMSCCADGREIEDCGILASLHEKSEH
jgi:Cd(II)/Pb(II)-responsive transcriptional regulator